MSVKHARTSSKPTPIHPDDVVVLVPLKHTAMPRSIVAEIKKEFRARDQTAVAALISLYQANWYLRANNFDYEANLCANIIHSYWRALKQRPVTAKHSTGRPEGTNL